MCNESKYLIDLLNAFIYNKQPELQYNDINWEEIKEISERNRIDGLIYGVVSDYLMEDIDQDIFNSWTQYVFKVSLTMHNFINIIVCSLNKLQKNNIELIVLKGLAIRNLYPNPDFRVMSDVDILVHKEDIDKIDGLLKENGYKEYSRTKHHITYKYKKIASIEVHWTLDKHSIKEKKYPLSKTMWDDAVLIEEAGVQFKSLCNEDLLTHLCFHMACHMAESGFGVRQLIDLVLVVNKNKDNINWNKFMNNIKACGIEKFTLVIFNVCNFLFQMYIPEEVTLSGSIKRADIEIVADEILKYGVYGNKDIDNIYSNKIGYNFTEKNVGRILINILQIIFPKSEMLEEKYRYAKENKLLLPVAYLFRIISIIKKVGTENLLSKWKNIAVEAKNKNRIYEILDI